MFMLVDFGLHRDNPKTLLFPPRDGGTVSARNVASPRPGWGELIGTLVVYHQASTRVGDWLQRRMTHALGTGGDHRC